MPPPKALIFDMDGVLVNSEPLHQRDWLTVFRQFSIDFPENELTQLQGLRGEQVIQRLREQFPDAAASVDMDALILEKRTRFLDVSLKELEAIPGAEDFLRSQKGQRPLGLVTSARLKTVGRVLYHFNWRNIFDALVGAEHVTHSKPHPEPFLKAVERFQLKPGECVVFEDSAVGVKSAVAAGCSVCGVTSTTTAEELLDTGARWTIPGFETSATLDEILQGKGGAKTRGWFSRFLKSSG